MEFESSITKITLRYQNNFIQVFTSYRIIYCIINRIIYCITLPYHAIVSLTILRNRITYRIINRIINRIIYCITQSYHVLYHLLYHQPYHILYHTTVSLTVSSTVSFTVSSTVSRNRITYGPFTPCINLNI